MHSAPGNEQIRRGSQSIHRAMALLREVARQNEPGIGVRELADSTGLKTATARRMLKALELEDMLAYDPARRVYRLGLGLHYLGATANQYDIRHKFRHALENLVSRTSETTYLAVRSGHDVLCLDRAEGTSVIRALLLEAGARAPLGIGSASLALLAACPDREINSVLQANRRRYPIYNDLTSADIRALVDRTRQTGYAVSEGNMDRDVIGVGLVARDSDGRPEAAIGVMSPAGRMDGARQREIAGIIAAEIRQNGRECDFSLPGQDYPVGSTLD